MRGLAKAQYQRYQEVVKERIEKERDRKRKREKGVLWGLRKRESEIDETKKEKYKYKDK